MKPTKTIYITVEEDGTDDAYLAANKDLNSINIIPGEERSVWIYELKERKKLICKSALK